ncbi:uncharacterized protein EI97DRAFT_431623 [Westerdykella ornata]|uniref:Uncharacterized protein n=1 Tax=Westerdykella ornata TaxID=318751 RepID=A0A6A6JRP9_WESOR|nr:uncharacterized protein EI97DRAFT_431623 [Westerdykella ornata]KAF2278396.1 hypothetical protein EI97DRAFT_431623 [Westerdykella ornata]
MAGSDAVSVYNAMLALLVGYLLRSTNGPSLGSYYIQLATPSTPPLASLTAIFD